MNEVFGNNISIIFTWGIEWGRCARTLDQEEIDTEHSETHKEFPQQAILLETYQSQGANQP